MSADRRHIVRELGVAALLVVAAHAGIALSQGCPATEATAAAAYPMLAAQPDRVLFVDVRTRAEIAFIGMPLAADANVPFQFLADDARWDEANKAFQLMPNPDFVAEVGRRLAAKGLTRDDPVVLMCQGGSRSAKAANALTAAGYTLVFSIVDGFEGDLAADGPTKGQRTVNGWKNAGLPWSYSLAREKMYRAN